MTTLRLERGAMGTGFEVWLVGEDCEHLAAVGEAALEEIGRVERLLSRFDPAAEVARVNRTAAAGPVLVDFELMAVLEDCRRWFDRTDGCFDVCAGSGVSFGEGVELDSARRTVRFLRPEVRLDLGGYGKGYALDAAGTIVERFGVSGALLHGGTSSVLARGVREDGSPWPVGIRDPWDDDRELTQLRLSDCGLSSSAVFGKGRTKGEGRRTKDEGEMSAVFGREEEASDILAPGLDRPLSEQASCVVLAGDATEAEVLSTALLVMGKERAKAYLENTPASEPFPRVGWIEQARPDASATPQARLEWLRGGRSD